MRLKGNKRIMQMLKENIYKQSMIRIYFKSNEDLPQAQKKKSPMKKV